MIIKHYQPSIYNNLLLLAIFRQLNRIKRACDRVKSIAKREREREGSDLNVYGVVTSMCINFSLSEAIVSLSLFSRLHGDRSRRT